ncbi:MAG: hypothetical protein FWG80_05040 [Alphaproteobacteria bacterium]|nr:hypothetical protein [Alphaproteobacteria bacterium]
MSKKEALNEAVDKITDPALQNGDNTTIIPEKKMTEIPVIGGQPDQQTASVSHFMEKAWNKIKYYTHGVFVRAPRAVWNWIRGIDIAGLTNCVLMLLIITLFSILIGQFIGRTNEIPALLSDNTKIRQVQQRPTTTARQPASRPMPVTINVPAEVTVSKTEDKFIVTLPLGKIVRPAIASNNIIPEPSMRKVIARSATTRIVSVNQTTPSPSNKPLIAELWIVGDTIIDGTHHDAQINKNTNIRGNLFLQNMRHYTLPCGLKVDGNLYLRNVNLLRFCGSFTVTGDIYVSKSSSFGPIPKNARLGGQVIF